MLWCKCEDNNILGNNYISSFLERHWLNLHEEINVPTYIQKKEENWSRKYIVHYAWLRGKESIQSIHFTSRPGRWTAHLWLTWNNRHLTLLTISLTFLSHNITYKSCRPHPMVNTTVHINMGLYGIIIKHGENGKYEGIRRGNELWHSPLRRHGRLLRKIRWLEVQDIIITPWLEPMTWKKRKREWRRWWVMRNKEANHSRDQSVGTQNV